jgi:dephospho-CoA kinase
MPDGKSLVITGGIGTGKSTVSGFLASLGWSISDADQVGHSVLLIPEVVSQIEMLWPAVIDGGLVDRKRLGDVVFARPGELARLEAITHPRIQIRLEDWLQSTTGPKAVELSVARLRKEEWGPVVVVDAPEGVRIERAAKRGLDRSAVIARIAAQPERQEWLQIADFVILNACPLEELEQAVIHLSRYVLDQ